MFNDIQPARVPVIVSGPPAAGSYTFMERLITVGDGFEHFLRVGHCLFALPAGLPRSKM
jgi:hypothetical protein